MFKFIAITLAIFLIIVQVAVSNKITFSTAAELTESQTQQILSSTLREENLNSLFHNGNAFHYFGEMASTSCLVSSGADALVRSVQQTAVKRQCGLFSDNIIRVCCPGFFCNFSSISCGKKGNVSFAELGTCEAIPTADCGITTANRATKCINSTDAGNVCGCDGKWYCNECEANKATVSVAASIARCQPVEVDSAWSVQKPSFATMMAAILVLVMLLSQQL